MEEANKPLKLKVSRLIGEGDRNNTYFITENFTVKKGTKKCSICEKIISLNEQYLRYQTIYLDPSYNIDEFLKYYHVGTISIFCSDDCIKKDIEIQKLKTLEYIDKKQQAL